MNWTFVEIIEAFRDSGKTWNIRVLLREMNMGDEQTIFFFFRAWPSEELILAESQKACDILSQPVPNGE